LDHVDDVKMRVGGLPAHPKPPLNYKLVFSARGLMNEYIEPAEVIRDGSIMRIPSLKDVEELKFTMPYGQMEAFTTSGGSSTLPRTFLGKVKNLDYKTIRYPGHAAIFSAMQDAGLLSGVRDESASVGTVSPRELTETILEKTLSDDDEDVILLRVTVSGVHRGVEGQWVFELIDHHDVETGHSAMARTTAYSAATVAHMLLSGIIEERGVLAGESVVPLDRYIRTMRSRGINITERWERT